jgi:hypothetical protein
MAEEEGFDFAQYVRAVLVGMHWFATLEMLKPKDLRCSRLNTVFLRS